MKKLVVIFSILAAVIIAALVFNFCTKQTEETGNHHSAHSVKVKKGRPVPQAVPCDYSTLYTSSPMQLPSHPNLWLTVDIVCCNGLIDGDFYIEDRATMVILYSGIYHVEQQGNIWIEGCNGLHFVDIPPDIINEMLGVLTDPLTKSWFCPCFMGATCL